MSKKKGVAKRPPEGLVLDGSVAAAWCFPDGQDAYPQSVLDALAEQAAVVPSFWHLEVANILLVGERRRRSTQADTVTWMSFLAALPITVDEETNARAFGDVTNLGRAHNQTADDDAYLELALRRGLPLASLDDQLNAAARAVGVPPYGKHRPLALLVRPPPRRVAGDDP